MLRVCKDCKEEKDTSLFCKALVKGNKTYYKHSCLSCHALATRERGWKRQGILGATLLLFKEKIKQQNYKCAICEDDISLSATLDHNHNTGLARGILCRICNTALGGFQDNIKNLENAMTYLKKWNTNA